MFSTWAAEPQEALRKPLESSRSFLASPPVRRTVATRELNNSERGARWAPCFFYAQQGLRLLTGKITSDSARFP